MVDDDRHLVGIVTNRDLRFEQDLRARSTRSATSENIITTNQSTNLEEAARILQQHKIEKLPQWSTAMAHRIIKNRLVIIAKHGY